MTVEFGSVREVWFAALDDPNTKYSFLIRDDAFSKGGAIFGRTTRLGDPISSGPGSSWGQSTWEGGGLQHDWADEGMYWEGNVDPFSHVGRIRMWPGWAHILKEPTRVFDSYSMGTGNDGPAIGNTKLYIGERNYYNAAGAPSGGFKAYKYAPDTNTLTQLPTTVSTLGTRGYTAICPATDDGSSNAYIYFGTGGGLWVYYETGNTFSQDTGASYAVNHDSLVGFRDALYYCSGKALVKRTPSAAFGIVGTHTIIKSHGSSYATQGLAVWNNRLWYGINFQGNKAMLGYSDGNTAQTIVEFPAEFQVLTLKAHYGALYIFGEKPQASAGSAIQPAAVAQVWKYTGSSLTLVWESDNEDRAVYKDGHPHIITGAASMGSLLMWGNPGYPDSVTPRQSIWCYDAEKDAIFEGPGMQMDPKCSGLVAGTLLAWDNTIACTYYDFKNYNTTAPRAHGVAYLRMSGELGDKTLRGGTVFGGRSVEYVPTEQMQFMVSSRYRGDKSVYGETKTWLSGQIVCRVPGPDASIRIYAITNEEKAYLVKTVSYDSSNTGWRTIKFPVKNPGSYMTFDSMSATVGLTLDAANSGKYLQSPIFQYRIELVNTGTQASTQNPEVDSIRWEWMPAPTKRRQWHMRFVMDDAQLRLAGTANPVTTAQAMADRLELFWSQNLPFRMWGPFASAVDPSTLDSSNCVEVIPSVESYNNNSYRLDTDGSSVVQETGITLIENVTT